MTALVAPNYQANRSTWSGANGAVNGVGTMSADEVSRMLMPRNKLLQRTNSGSSVNSLSSSASTSNSTISAASTSASQASGSNAATSAEWSRKRTTRGIWPAAKSEPIAGLSSARPQYTSTTSGSSAASSIFQSPSTMNQQNAQTSQQQNGLSRPQQQMDSSPAVLYLTPMNGTFERKTITVPFYPDVLRIGRQTNNKTLPTPQNGYFDSKVLSRQHAEIWADRNGKIWIRDVKSSNGTFVNGERLSQENKDSDPHELREQDMLELGIDIVSEDQKTVVHHKVAARVEHAGFYANNSILDLNFGDVDVNASAGLMGSALGQGLGQMRRTGGQSSLGSNSRMSTGSQSTGNLASVQQRQQHFWLTPVNMDKIIQKLNAEYKAAKQQSLDLQRTAQYIDSVLSSEQQPVKKEVLSKASPVEKSKGLPSLKDNLKSRFSDPPAPPPQAPLPEKPDAAVLRQTSVFGISAFQSTSLDRSDTEKPKVPDVNHSPLKIVSNGTVEPSASADEMADLVESLTKTKQEVQAQSARLREVEDQLVQERVRREDAEERARRLEKERQSPLTQRLLPPAVTNQESQIPIHDATESNEIIGDLGLAKKLQDRLDQLLIEFHEVKASAERWKLDKEVAEKEREEERRERKTLAEMVEQFRAQEAERLEREKKREVKRGRRRSRSASTDSTTVNSLGEGHSPKLPGDEGENGSEAAPASKPETKENGHEQNGHAFNKPKHAQGSDQFDTQALTRRGPDIAHAAPYLSAMSVVLIGVAFMTLVNKMQAGESVKG